MTRARLCKESIDGILSYPRKLIACALLLTMAGVVLTARSISTNTANIDVTKGAPVTKAHDESVTALPHRVRLTPDRLPRLLITIRPTGFDPSEVTVPDGPFLLAIDNKSGLDSVTLQLTRDGGQRVRQMHLSVGRHKWREKITLSLGKYLLTEADHPNWLSRIIVAP